MVYDFRDYTRFHSWLNPFIDLPVDVLVSVFGGDPFMSSGMLLVSRNKPPVSTLTHLDITTVTPVDRFSLFSTPLYVYDMPQMEVVNHELTQRLLTESEASPGIRRSNRGGWHSAPDLGHRSEACYRTVMQMMIDQVAATIHDLAASMRMPAPPPMRYSAQAWAMVMRDGDYTIVHDHATAHWSVSYYVDAGDADVDNHPESGLFAVLDPRRYSRPIPGLDDFSMTQFTVRPRSGRLVIFPGWLQHYVHPYRGTRPRIAIACNVSVAPELLNPSPTLG